MNIKKNSTVPNDITQSGELLPLMEQFYTIQGEGCHQGTAAYFIRVGGCDVGCHWCDVKDSWDEHKHPLTAVSEITQTAKSHPSDIVIVTGGEPLTWNMNPLTQSLKKENLQTHIETSGAYPLTGQWDWICLSPKKVKLPKPEIYTKANELKCIIYNKSDFEFAQQQAQKVHADCLLYLQPEWSVAEKITPLIIDYVKKNPQWKISLQTHKYLDIP